MAKQYTDEDLKRYYSIGEVAKLLGVSTTKIRYWDREFAHLKPSKNSRGDRRFTKENVKQLQQIQYLLMNRGFTIEGARREIAEQKKPASDERSAIIASLQQVKQRLQNMLE